MHLQIGDDLRTVHNAQLVYSNRQDIALTLLTGFKIWLVHNCQTEEDHLNIKIVTALLLYNACTLLNMMEICVTNAEPWWLSGLERQSNSSPMLKVEGSNPGASVCDRNLIASVCVCIGLEHNLEISVV